MGAVPLSVPDPFLVVGIPAPSYSAVDISNLFFHSDVCGCDVSAVRAALSRADGGLRELQGLLLFPATMDIQLNDDSVFGGSLGHFHQGERVLARDRALLLRSNRFVYFVERRGNQDQG